METKKLDEGITAVRQRGDVAWSRGRLDVRLKGARKVETARPEGGYGRMASWPRGPPITASRGHDLLLQGARTRCVRGSAQRLGYFFFLFLKKVCIYTV
jgi:hypothetical protein